MPGTVALSFSADMRDDLPPLAWLVDATRPWNPILYCGSSVMVGDGAFAEGAWDGALSDWGFDACPDVFGSGGKIVDGGIRFVPPSHTLEPLFYFQRPKGPSWIVSNSLAFLLTYAGDRLDLANFHLGETFAGIVQGIRLPPAAVELKAGTLQIGYHHNGILTRAGALHFEPKPLPGRFVACADYAEYLERVLRAVFINASDPRRPRQYVPLATVSSGYDSPACAALARKAGCQKAVTFSTSRAGDSDSGTAIGSSLGLTVTNIERPAPAAGSAGREAEFFATGMQAEDFIYSALDEVIRHRVFVTGFHGDKIWSLHNGADPSLKRGDISGSSLGEFRLARDFIHIPLPFVGAQRHEDVLRIANSDEMRPYSLQNLYDRPIPRRIAESAGVPRESFGCSKKAVSVLLFRDFNLLSREARTEIKRYGRHLTAAARVRYMLRAIRFRTGLTFFSAVSRLRHVASGRSGMALDRLRQGGFQRLFGHPYEVFEHTHPFTSLALVWALDRIAPRYASLDNRGHAQRLRRSAPASRDGRQVASGTAS